MNRAAAITAARDDAVFNELIARLAKLSLVGRPFVG